MSRKLHHQKSRPSKAHLNLIHMSYRVVADPYTHVGARIVSGNWKVREIINAGFPRTRFKSNSDHVDIPLEKTF